jgi:hypothetical protein
MTVDKQNREFAVPIFFCNRVTQMPPFCVPQNVGFSLFPSLYLPNNDSENISSFYLPIFDSVAKNLFLGNKKYCGGGEAFALP